MKQICLFLIIACLVGCFGAEPQKTGKEGKSMPDFSILLTDSSTRVHTRDIPIGKPTILFYFSPYCPYCRAQIKSIKEHIDDLQGIQFYFISNFPLSAIKQFYKETELANYHNITVGIDSAHAVTDYFEVPGYPYMAIYGKNKKLNKSFLGKMYSSQIKKIAEE